MHIADGRFAYRRREAAITAEAALDGLYIVHTSFTAERLNSVAVVETYKRLSAVERDRLSAVERDFRALKGDDFAVWPIFHYRQDRGPRSPVPVRTWP